PMLRASGVPFDVRKLGYAAYGELELEPVTASDGDSFARCEVRIKELFQSFDLIRQAVAKIPAGPIAVPVKGNPSGEHFMRIEQPRGEAIYYVKANGTRFIDRFRLRTPTTSNIPPMLEMLKGCQLADVPLLILTIDPCISCTERSGRWTTNTTRRRPPGKPSPLQARCSKTCSPSRPPPAIPLSRRTIPPGCGATSRYASRTASAAGCARATARPARCRWTARPAAGPSSG